MPDQRLPELFSGADRVAGRPAGDVRRRVPAAGVGGGVGAHAAALRRSDSSPTGAGGSPIVRPLLPGRATELELAGLPVGGTTVDLRFTRAGDGTVAASASGEGASLVDLPIP